MVTLGIDFGTSSTVAVLGLDDGRVVTLSFDGSPLLPSAVCLGDDGGLLAGRDAVEASRSRPDAFEPHPKARLADGQVTLAGRVVAVADLVGAVLRRVRAEAVAVAPVDRVVMTFPAGWDGLRRQVLVQAAAWAGLPAPVLVAEPVAAAAFAELALNHPVPVGACVVVCDLGAGGFDASVLRRTPEGFVLVATQGAPDAGGLDLDAAIVVEVGATHGAHNPAAWHRLSEPATPGDRWLAQVFWDNARLAKEALSYAPAAAVAVPILDVQAALGRERVDHLARPLLDRAAAATRQVLQSAGVAQVAGVVLVGGGARLPLAAPALHAGVGLAPRVIEQPELAVAGGTLHVGTAGASGVTSTQAPPVPWQNPPAGSPPNRRIGLVVAAALVALFVVAGVVAGVVVGVRQLGGGAAEVAQQGTVAPAGAEACRLPSPGAYPPLASGFDRRLATVPVVTDGPGDVTALVRTVLIEGPCEPVKAGQTITVNYVLVLGDGKVFDSSWQQSRTFDTPVGHRQLGLEPHVIEGWDSGLVGVRVGSRVQLDVPPRMAYGESPPPGAPAGPLRFVVDVLAAADS